METDLVSRVAVEVPDERLITRATKDERVLRPPVAELVLDVELALRRPIDGHGVFPVPVEVADDGDVTRASEEEGDIRPASRVGVLQVDEPVGLPVEPDGLVAVAVPVAGE